MRDTNDVGSNPTDNPHLDDLIRFRVNRRQVLGGGLATAEASFLGRDGRVWIQKDISNRVQNLASRVHDRLGNNQMLVANPDTGELKRCPAGPRECEITGVITTPDHTTMFVNVQHPGESTIYWKTLNGAPSVANPRTVSNWLELARDCVPHATLPRFIKVSSRLKRGMLQGMTRPNRTRIASPLANEISPNHRWRIGGVCGIVLLDVLVWELIRRALPVAVIGRRLGHRPTRSTSGRHSLLVA